MSSGAGVRNNKNNKRSGARTENAASKVAKGNAPSVIVGLGASAGGIIALERFFAAMPQESGGAFVVILHLDPTHDSSVAAILGRKTAMPVSDAVNGELVQRDRVYVIPPNRMMKIDRGRLQLSPPAEPRGWRMPIDHFLSSLGEDQRQRAIGIVLSGTGSDGTNGLTAIKSAGGLTMAQDPTTAEHGGMSRSAIARGVVDHVLQVDDMPDHVVRYANHAYTNNDGEPGEVGAAEDADLGAVLAILRTRVRMDFSSYRKGTIRRRMQRRMGIRHMEEISEYLRLLREDPVEVQQLAADMLIGVTGFFREREAWTKLEELVLKPLIASKSNDEPIRVWVPACATGEEAYGLTVLLFHHIEQAHKNCPVQVFATDIDHAALERARAGLFPESIAAEVGPDHLQQYFVKEGDRYQVGKAVRDAVTFAAQNVIGDPPYSKLDLISCRNLLIYLEPDTQRRLLSLFHFALLDGGYLFLGSSETIGTQVDQFATLSRKWRIYKRTGATLLNPLDLPMRDGLFGAPRPAAERPEPAGDRAVRHAEQAVLRRFAPACVVVDRSYEIRYLFGPTERYLKQPSGPLTSNIFEWCKGMLRTRLRAALHRVWDQGDAVEIVELRGGREDEVPFRATIEKLKDAKDLAGMVLIAFHHEPRPQPAAEPDVVDRDETLVQKLEDELKQTREDLKTTIEELQTSNEEFRAVNEEALSINEELQSTNEELGTSKEELQSLNEELLTVNFQLQTKLGELEQRNDDLDNLLRSTDLAAIFLDRKFCIKWFSPAMTSLLSLIPSDLGRPLGDFAQRFTDPDLMRDAETVLRDLAPISREIQTHEGRWYLRRLLPYRTRADSINGIVITFADIHALRQAEQKVKDRNESLERTIAARTAILTVLQDVAGAANRATSVDEAIRMAIQLVCVHAGFDLGHAWRIDDTTHTVVPLDVWYVAPGRDYSDFMEVTMRTVLGPGDGVIRRTLALGEPQWMEDVRGQEFVRGAFEKFGIRSVATLPVLVEGRPVVVLEMFSSTSLSIPGNTYLPSLKNVGIHIGHVIERQTLEKQVADQTDRERRNIGQELHDSVGQSLAGLAMMTRELVAQLEGTERPKLSSIEALHRGIEGAKNELRNVIRGMLPVEFDGNGLMNALLDLAEATETMHSVKCRFVSDDPELVAIDDGFMGAQLYRIAQEAVRNAVTHGEATGIEIALRGRRRIELEVTDDGHGDWTHADTRGSGVRIMRYRADLIGGRIEVVAERGKGTRVICIVPRRPQAVIEPESRT